MTNKAKPYSDIQVQSMDDLIEQHAGLVQRIAYHLSARLPASVLVDDLIQAGLIGLMDAAGHYDPSQGASFETYAAIRIRGAMLDELRRNDWAPKSVHRKSREMMAAIHKIESRNNRDARPQEIAEQMGISLEEYHELVMETNTCRVLNFAEVEFEDQDFTDSVADTRNSGPLGGIQNEEFRHYLAEAIRGLPEREQLIVSLYYDEELNLKEIGCVLGVSESRVSQLLSQAHLRMRTTLSEFLEPELHETG
jgi:RNA polymerase sigma factor for flagellar operon FliA